MFQEKSIQITINNQIFNLLEVNNFDELFDSLLHDEANGLANVEDHIPYWTILWPSAVGLAEYILTYPEIIRDKKVIEIGAGLGLPAIICNTLDAQRVVATDLLTDALVYCRKNAELNNRDTKLELEVMDWTKQMQHLNDKYDVILAADIVYESRFVDHFINGIRAIANKGNSALILLAEPSRSIASRMIDEIEIIVGVTTSSSTLSINFNNLTTQVNIHQIWIDTKSN